MKQTRFILTIAVACLARPGQTLAQGPGESPITFFVPVTLQDMPPEVAGLEVSCDLTSRADPNFPKLIAIVSSMDPRASMKPTLEPPGIKLMDSKGTGSFVGNVTARYIAAGTPAPVGPGIKPGAMLDPKQINWAGATHYQCKLFLYGPREVPFSRLGKVPVATPPQPKSLQEAMREAASPLSPFSWARPKPGSTFTLDTQPVPIPQGQ